MVHPPERLTRFLFVLMTLTLAVAAMAQGSFTVNGRLKIEGGDLTDAKVQVFKNGVLVNSLTSGLNKFSLEMDLQATYELSFEKAGYVAKKLSFNTRVPADEAMTPFTPFQFAVSLFKQYSDVNMVVFDQPVGVIRYEDSTADFDYDTDYTRSIQKQMQATMAEVERKKKEESDAAAENGKRQVADQRAMVAANAKAEADRKSAEKKAAEDAIAARKAEEARKAAEARAETERKAAEKKVEEERLVAARKVDLERVNAARRAEEERLSEVRRQEEAERRAAADRKAEEDGMAAAHRADEAEALRRAEAERRAAAIAKASILVPEQRTAMRPPPPPVRAEEPRPAAVRREPLRVAVGPATPAQASVGEEARRSTRPVIGRELRPANADAHADAMVERSEELVVEPNKVMTVVRLEREGKLTEYRKVIHKWGGTFYFRNNDSISQLAYEQEALDEQLVSVEPRSKY